MTPFEIDILMHYATRADDHPSVDAPPPIWKDTIDRLYAEDMLREGKTRSHDATERCYAYIEALERVPLPTATWTIESVDFKNLERPF